MRVFDLVLYRQPAVIAELERRGLLVPDTLEVASGPELHPIGWWERLMAHDAWRRVRGAIRQVRWAG